MPAFPPSPPPVRNSSGANPNFPFQVLADSGYGDPAFYHQFFDDFDNQLGATGLYTVTAAGGSVAHTAGDGGLALFTTGAVANNFASIQLPAGSFTLPGTGNNPPGTSLSSRKFFYFARGTVSVGTASLIMGMSAVTATPFTTGVTSILDGLYFYKPPTTNVLSLINVASAGNSPSGSGFSQTFTLPFTVTPGTFLEVGYYVDRNQNIRAWVASQLFGYIPPSGTGATSASPVNLPLLPQVGPIFANYNFQAQSTSPVGQTFVNPIMFTTANLTPTLAVSNGTTASAATGTFDFHGAQKER